MDAFYASVELLHYPELRGLPLVVGGRRRSIEASGGPAVESLRQYAGRGVITTATYEARAFGLHSGMALMKAAKLAPDALLLPANFDEYRRYSKMFKDAVSSVCPHIEDRGIDEIYLDLSDLVLHSEDSSDDTWVRAGRIARSIQRVVHESTQLSCSIGVSPNKLLSKIASDLQKPGGLTILTPADVTTRIWPLPVRVLHGIGPRASARLEKLDVHTVGELALTDRDLLVEHFGKSCGAWMYDAAHGRDDRPVVTCSEPKSISRETTFEHDLHPVKDRSELSTVFSQLCIKVAEDLQKKGYVGKTIGLKLRYDNFKTVTRDCTLDEPTGDATTIRGAASACLKRVALDRRIRLLGVRVTSLRKRVPQVAREAVTVSTSPMLFD
jgi:DNA polymerase-4